MQSSCSDGSLWRQSRGPGQRRLHHQRAGEHHSPLSATTRFCVLSMPLPLELVNNIPVYALIAPVIIKKTRHLSTGPHIRCGRGTLGSLQSIDDAVVLRSKHLLLNEADVVRRDACTGVPARTARWGMHGCLTASAWPGSRRPTPASAASLALPRPGTPQPCWTTPRYVPCSGLNL